MQVLVFDSGVGGLSVVRDLRAVLPELHLDYVADDMFRPYGDKREADLKTRLPELLRVLELMLRPDVIVIACNTASTAALSDIRAAVGAPVVGVVPAIKPAAKLSKTRTIGVLGTPGTVRRKYVQKLIEDYASGTQVLLHGSTGLVDLAERKLAGDKIETRDVLAELGPLLERKGGDQLDTIVLACTHFPLLLDELKAAVPQIDNWVDSGVAIANRTQHILKGLPQSDPTGKPQTAFSIGGEMGLNRAQLFQNFGFEKTVRL